MAAVAYCFVPRHDARFLQAIKDLPDEQKSGVVDAYVSALRIVFLAGVGAGGLAFLASFLLVGNPCVFFLSFISSHF
jgi:hypothetical protein